MKYKIFASLFILLCGCGSPNNEGLSHWMAQDGKMKVLSTTAMIDDLVAEIGADRIHHTVLIQGDLDPHSYELVKGDDEKMALADIVFFNGLGLEHGASLRTRLQNHPHPLSLGNEILKAKPEALLKVDGQIDPHVWMDVSLWAEATDAIARTLSSLDPEGASLYEERALALKEKLLNVHTAMQMRLHDVAQEKRYLVTSHDAFNYFTKAYLAEDQEGQWQKRFAAPEGLAPEGQLSSNDIQKIIQHLKDFDIHVVFPESNVSRDSLKKIVCSCKEMQHPVKICSCPLYGDAMGHPGSDADSYLKMMQHNVEVLVNEWK